MVCGTSVVVCPDIPWPTGTVISFGPVGVCICCTCILPCGVIILTCGCAVITPAAAAALGAAAWGCCSKRVPVGVPAACDTIGRIVGVDCCIVVGW